jgi:hypothetical protein
MRAADRAALERYDSEVTAVLASRAAATENATDSSTSASRGRDGGDAKASQRRLPPDIEKRLRALGYLD